MSKSLATAVVFAGLALGAAAQTPSLFTRDVQIPAAGPARVPLDLGTLRQMAPEAAGLRVLGPDGREIPFRLVLSLPESRRHPAPIVETRQEAGSRVLELDLEAEGADQALGHERLFLDALRSGPAPAVLLEGSPDRAVWQTLAEAEPVVVGDAGGVQRLSLSYPSTSDRYLRLRWPAGAGEISAAEVETLTGPTLTTSARGSSCGHPAEQAAERSWTACTLELPAAGQVLRRLTLDIAGPGQVGYRLYTPRNGGWSPLAEGVFRRSAERSTHFLAGGPERIAGTSLLLELYGSGDAAPRLTRYGIDLAVPTVVFEARQPGRHTLSYGGPPLPAALGGQLGRTRFAASWSIAAPSVKPGDLVRLELPDAVYGAAREDLGDLRVAVGGRQIPFFRWTPSVPARAAGVSMRPGETGTAGESQVVVSLPVAGLPLTEIHLTAPPLPLRRPVQLRYLAPDRFSEPETREPAVWETWECVPEAPLPCRERLPLSNRLSTREARAPRLLAVRFDDADNPPLPAVDATVWRRRDVLLFVWPESEDELPVRLLAGSRELEAPSYDFASLGEVLLGYPWRPAEVDLAGAAAAAEPPWWNRWVMPMALAVATACLLLLLRRILSEPDPET